jgi:hypothetical protein
MPFSGLTPLGKMENNFPVLENDVDDGKKFVRSRILNAHLNDWD